MKIDALKKRIAGLEAEANRGAIPTTTRSGNKTWVKGQGSGIRFMHEILAASGGGDYPSLAELSQDLQGQVDLWSRPEVGGSGFGDLVRSNRELALHILGLNHGEHL